MTTKNTNNLVAIDSKTTKKTPAEKFAANLTKNSDGCYIWDGYVNKVTGHGETYFDHDNMGSHRAAYILKFGPIPNGKYVCHTCDVKTCCFTGDKNGKGTHLVLGDAAFNNRDKASKGRSTKGRKINNTRFTADEKNNILTMTLEGKSTYAISQKTGRSVPGLNKFLQANRAELRTKLKAKASTITQACQQLSIAINTILDEAA